MIRLARIMPSQVAAINSSNAVSRKVSAKMRFIRDWLAVKASMRADAALMPLMFDRTSDEDRSFRPV